MQNLIVNINKTCSSDSHLDIYLNQREEKESITNCTIKMIKSIKMLYNNIQLIFYHHLIRLSLTLKEIKQRKSKFIIITNLTENQMVILGNLTMLNLRMPILKIKLIQIQQLIYLRHWQHQI